MDCRPPGSSVHGILKNILQAKILEWVAISSSRRSLRPRDQTCVSCIAGRFFTTEQPGKPMWHLLITSWNDDHLLKNQSSRRFSLPVKKILSTQSVTPVSSDGLPVVSCKEIRGFLCTDADYGVGNSCLVNFLETRGFPWNLLSTSHIYVVCPKTLNSFLSVDSRDSFYFSFTYKNSHYLFWTKSILSSQIWLIGGVQTSFRVITHLFIYFFNDSLTPLCH